MGGFLGILYRLKNERERYIRTGSALLFLSALLFGASLFLIAQIYNLNANESTLVLVWILGVFPLIYGYQSAPIAGLCSMLFYLWIGLLYNERTDLNQLIDIWNLCIISGIGLYYIGILNSIMERIKQLSLPFKFVGLQASLFVLFIYTFEKGNYHTVGKIVPAIYALLGVLFLAATLLSKPLRERFTKLHEDLSMPVIAFSMAGITLGATYTQASEGTYAVIFNILFLGLLIILLYAGYGTEDFRTIYTSMIWFALLILARYFDFFWGLLPRSIFFALGGLILLVMSAAMERKRRALKAQFAGGQQ